LRIRATCAGPIPGGHTKNLFVKDKKGRLFLLVLCKETVVDLKRVHEKIGAQGRVSFGSAELLEEVWGVKPGAVTPFVAINDQERDVPRRSRRGIRARPEGGFAFSMYWRKIVIRAPPTDPAK